MTKAENQISIQVPSFEGGLGRMFRESKHVGVRTVGFENLKLNLKSNLKLKLKSLSFRPCGEIAYEETLSSENFTKVPSFEGGLGRMFHKSEYARVRTVGFKNLSPLLRRRAREDVSCE